MKAEILSTGDELRSGAIIDSNSAYIAEKLEQAGMRVARHMCVGDDQEILVSALSEIGARADMAIVTGGLGPTMDDITALAAAKAAGVSLSHHEAAFLSIEQALKSRGFPMTPADEKQAALPDGSEWIKNDVGIAPGFSLKIGQCIFFFLPGVPSEMQRMLSDRVLPLAIKRFRKETLFLKTINISTFGLSESDVNNRISEFSTRFPSITPGLRAAFPGIHVKLYARETSESALESATQEAMAWICEKLGTAVFSTHGKSLPEKIGGLLKDRNATLAIAESCTGGLISHMITDVPGSSDYFLLSKVTYSNESKIKALHVSSSTIETYGAVHEATAAEMAAQVRKIANATYGLSTSGVAGPGGGSKEKPVGTVCIGLATPDSVESRTLYFPFKSRLSNKRIFAFTALDMLRKKLI